MYFSDVGQFTYSEVWSVFISFNIVFSRLHPSQEIGFFFCCSPRVPRQITIELRQVDFERQFRQCPRLVQLPEFTGRRRPRLIDRKWRDPHENYRYSVTFTRKTVNIGSLQGRLWTRKIANTSEGEKFATLVRLLLSKAHLLSLLLARKANHGSPGLLCDRTVRFLSGLPVAGVPAWLAQTKSFSRGRSHPPFRNLLLVSFHLI